MASGRAQARERKAEETQAKNDTTAAVQAIQPSELETLQNKTQLDFLKQWNEGRDVKDIKGLSPYMDLYNGAKSQQSGERIGGGLFNASGPNTSGLATALKAQNQARREQEASGQLMNAANSAYQYASGVLAPSLMQASDNRQMARANITNNRYQTLLSRPPQQHPFLNLLGGLVGSAGQMATGMLSGGGSGGGNFSGGTGMSGVMNSNYSGPAAGTGSFFR